MKKIVCKIVCLLFIVPCLFFMIGCTNTADSVTNNTNSSYTDCTDNSDDVPKQDNNSTNDENKTEEDNVHEIDKEESQLPETSDKNEVEDTNDKTLAISFSVRELFPAIIQTIETPLEVSAYFYGLNIDSNNGILYYCFVPDLNAEYAFHFKNKIGKNIVTTNIDNEEHLIFDVYMRSMYPGFNLIVNSENIYTEKSEENLINKTPGFEIYKYSFDIIVTSDTTICLDCINF